MLDPDQGVSARSKTMDTHRGRPPSLSPNKTPTTGWRLRVALGVAVAALMALTPVAAQDGCREAERNMQCTSFGTISMDSQRSIRGESIDLVANVQLDTAYEDQGARWLLFSVRNVEGDGSNPVTIELTSFSTPYGDVVTTRVEHATPNELNLWVDVLDTPIDTPITLDLKVGSTERGAFRLETLVMAFDRGYTPMKDTQGNDVSLFSFTLLGVNEETPSVASEGGSIVEGKKLPGLETGLLVAAIAMAGLLSRRRFA